MSSKTEPAQQPEQPVEEADLKERMDNFQKDLLPLLAKYELGLAAIPKFSNDGRVGADPVLVSVRGRLQKQEEKSELADPSK